MEINKYPINSYLGTFLLLGEYERGIENRIEKKRELS